MLDFSAKFDIITMLLARDKRNDANGVIGSTADSDSVSRGSSPFSVAGNLPDGRFPYFSREKVCGAYFLLQIGVWLSLVERYVRDVEAAGSNPVTPIFLLRYRKV